MRITICRAVVPQRVRASASTSPATGAKFSLLPPDNSTGNYTHVIQRIPVRIAVTSGLDAEHPLRPGMSVQIVITTRAS